MVIPDSQAVFALGLVTAWVEGLPIAGFLHGAPVEDQPRRDWPSRGEAPRTNSAAQPKRHSLTVTCTLRSRSAIRNFAFVLQKVPGAILWLGIKNAAWREPKPVHTATFDLDESALPIGSSVMAGVALDYLKPA